MSNLRTKPTLHENWIDPLAKKIVHTLQTSGFETYLVGGCVRDLLVGIHPKDFDIATNAQPNEVRRKVPNSYVIGRRFRLVLVKRGDTQFEVATFRRNIKAEELEGAEDGEFVGDNFFGTCEEDAKRRDFTINALFYDPMKHQLLDFVDAQKDIESGLIRMIGDPTERFIEDPIRILRAVRLSHRVQFSMEPELRKAAALTAAELKKSALPRRREEYLKLLRLPEPWLALTELFDLGILEQILPGLHQLYEQADKISKFEHLLSQFNRAGINKQDPVELFGAFMYAFIRANYDQNNILEIIDDPNLSLFMKDELGIFKVEAIHFVKSLEYMSSLHNKETYIRKGHRRQQSFVQNNLVHFALKLGLIDGSISDKEYYFWLNEIKNKSNTELSN